MLPVYLEDFVVCKPPEDWRVNSEESLKGAKINGWSNEAVAFARKVHSLVGMSHDGTFVPPCINTARTKITAEHTSAHRGKEEAMVTLVGTAKQLLTQTGVSASDIDIVITACSIYCPTPSLSSLLVSQLGLREDIMSYSLGGMGCSSGVIAILLARELLQAYPNKRVLLVAAEIATAGYYRGKEVKGLLANVIFRSGGAAALISNRPDAARGANYRLVTCTRAHGAASNPDAYKAVEHSPDAEGIMGLFLSKELPKQAGCVLEKCVRKIAPEIMTWSQYAEFAQQAMQHLWKTGSLTMALNATSRSYIPDFTRCIDHFALHAGGYMVVKAIKDSMKLTPQAVMATLASLRDYGNTSVSCSWYAWAYCEAVQDIRRGQALRDIPPNRHEAWAHLNGVPYQDADLPRSIMEDSKAQAEFDAAAAKAAAATDAGGRASVPSPPTP